MYRDNGALIIIDRSSNGRREEEWLLKWMGGSKLKVSFNPDLEGLKIVIVEEDKQISVSRDKCNEEWTGSAHLQGVLG